MSKKKYYFLSGLPRSGNTVLASILNQNPKIKVSANSFLSTILCYILDQNTSIAFKNFPDEKSLHDCASVMFDSYYQSWKSEIIIDRGPWGTDGNLEILNKYSPNKPKFICLLRNLNEILCSFIMNYHKNGGLDISDKKSVEEMCYRLLEQNGMIQKGIWSVDNLSKIRYKFDVYFMHYDNFCLNPQKEIENIYDFLNLKKYNHNFNNIKQYEVNGIQYDDSVDLLYKNLHKVKEKIEKTKHNVEDILPTSIIEMYKNVTFEHLKN